MSIKVSVIVPVYNVEKYLKECLDSILAQTLSEIEIIAINDGSPDNSLTILREYEKKDSRVLVIDKENEGVGKARNDGIRKAKGEFIAFMDSDDFYPSNTVLEKLYNTAIESESKIAGGRRCRLLPNGEVVKDSFSTIEKQNEFDAECLSTYRDYQYDYGYTQYIYNREMIVENDIYFPPYRRFQDPPFFVKAMITAGEFYVVDCESYCYRMVHDTKKYSIKNTIDFLNGLTDNLKISRENNLAKLHYLTAMRLYEDASFMATQNLFEKDALELIEKMIKVIAVVDTEWLKNKGYDLPKPFVPEVFQYAISTAEKYEKIRKNVVFGFLNIIRK